MDASTAAGLINVFTDYHPLYNNNKKRRRPHQTEIISSRNVMIKKTKNNRGSNNNANYDDDHVSNNNNNNNALDNDLVLCEILARLPVKTLMRFKSVCKHWMSSIRHDTHFHHLHFKHSETRSSPLRLFTVTYKKKEIIRYQVSDSRLIDLAAFHTFMVSEKMLSVNGLACLVNRTHDAVRIYNPSTREETQWIQTNNGSGGRFLFGFDPVTKKHKVLCYRQQIKDANSDHEVLTVGDNSWRRIDNDPLVPNNNLRGSSVYVNGGIYWLEKISQNKWVAPELLVAFDVGSEKFRVIPIPDFIFNQPRDETYWYKFRRSFTNDLSVVNGRVALLRIKNTDAVTMWMFDDDHHKGNWTEVIITLHFNSIGRNTIVRFSSVPGTDQIILKPLNGPLGIAYCHNWKMNTFKKLDYREELDCALNARIPSRDKALFVESLFPVM